MNKSYAMWSWVQREQSQCLPIDLFLYTLAFRNHLNLKMRRHIVFGTEDLLRKKGFSIISLYHVVLMMANFSFWSCVGIFTSVAKPRAWRSRTTYHVMSSCHHSRPCRAENSNAWWLLCHPSPNASNATHLRQ